jgi:hypothetical protein
MTAYQIVRELENGELMLVARREDKEDAARLIESLEEHWPGKYSILTDASSSETES